jgi:hypothetical protein
VKLQGVGVIYEILKLLFGGPLEGEAIFINPTLISVVCTSLQPRSGLHLLTPFVGRLLYHIFYHVVFFSWGVVGPEV